MSGCLPACIHNNKLYLLFGRENRFNDTPGYADFGGGIEKGESKFESAIRELEEETTGMLGSKEELKKMLKKNGTYDINFNNSYTTFVFHYHYDPYLTHYFNNTAKFLQKRLEPGFLKKSVLFEKCRMEWICADDLMKRKKEFRSFYQNLVNMIYEQRQAIRSFIKNKGKQGRSAPSKTRKHQNKNNKTLKNR